jgi:putative flippase GtrA
MNTRVQTLSQNRHARQFVKYVLVGLLTTALNFTIYALLLYLGAHYLSAATVAFMIATLNSYTWNRVWTYRAGPHRHIRLAKFTVIQVIGLAINLTVLFSLVEYGDVHKLLAQLLANACVVLVTFTGNKFWTFRE